MAVRDTLNKVEELVAGASHLPLTGKALIDEDELSGLIDELRHALPQELDRAEEIIRERDNIIKSAQEQADKIIKQAEQHAERLVDENDIVTKARENARMVVSQAHQQSNEIIERARAESRQLKSQAKQYVNQSLDQLISHVTNTFNGVQAAEAGLEQARQVLHQAKVAMNQDAYAYSQAQAQPPPQQPKQPQPQNYQQPPKI